MADIRKKIPLWQVEEILYDNLSDKPTTWDDLNLSGDFPFVSLDEQTLTVDQQNQVKTNLNIASSEAVTIGTPNGLSLDGQELSLGLATTGSNGAMSSADKLKLAGGNVLSGSGISLTGTATGRLLSAGDLTLSVDATVLRVSGDQTIVGLKSIRRSGPNDGSSAQIVKRYEIGSDNLYKLDLLNTKNVQEPNGEVQWLYNYTSNAGLNTPKSRDMIGFARGAVTILGGRAVPNTYYPTIITEELVNEADPNYRYPLRQYAYGISQFEGGMIVGTDAIRLDKITSDTKLYIEGGISTLTPSGSSASTATWFLGTDEVDHNSATDIRVRIRVGNKIIGLTGIDLTP